LRACYLCGPIADCAGIYYSETLYHTLLECAHPRMCAMREKLKADISSLALSPAALAISPNPPLVFGESELWATMLLCSSTGGFPTGTVPIVEVENLPPLRRSGRIPSAPTAHRDGHMQFARLQADGLTQAARLRAGSKILPPSLRLSGYGSRLELASAPFGTLDVITAHVP